MCDRRRIRVTYGSPVKLGDNMEIKLQVSNSFGFATDAMALFNRIGQLPGTEAQVRLHYNKEESTQDYSVFKGNIQFNTPGYRTFFIKLQLDKKWFDIKLDEITDEPRITNHNLAFWEVFAYQPTFNVPDWIKGGIMYQIFVDTFHQKDLPERFKAKIVEWNADPKWKADSDGTYRNNQFYGGNIRGIIEKLPYIKSLGTTVIYLTPIFQSPSSNKYDIKDYEMVDEMFGSWDEVKELVEKAHSLDMYIVVDCVFNHSSNENGLLKQCPDMYAWKEKYTIPQCWWGYTHLVEFNKYTKEYFQKLTEWLELYKHYMDGIRLDVADNLPDFVLKYIRIYFPKYILGEVWKNAIKGEFREFLYGDELDGVMNYQFANAIYRYVRWGNFVNFRQIVSSIYKLYPHEALSASPIFLTSHDIPRMPNILVGEFMKESASFENVWDMEKNGYWYTDGQFDTHKFRNWEYENNIISKEMAELAYNLQRIAVFLQYTLPGLPSVFAGDEAGVMGFKDPFNRKTFPWNNIDEKRYEFYCKMGKFRASYREIFAKGDFEICVIDEEKIIYRRDSLIFMMNRTDHNSIIPSKYMEGKNVIFTIGEGLEGYELHPYSAVVVK